MTKTSERKKHEVLFKTSVHRRDRCDIDVDVTLFALHVS